MKNISILGSTGSIGTQTLDIVRANDDLNVVAIAAGSNITKLEEQIREFHPELVCVFNEDAALKLKDAVKDTSVKLVAGMDGLIEAAVYEKAEIVVTAFVGMIGIRPTLEAIKAGKDIALANKETLVTAGHIVMSMAKEYGVKILPVDSEHSAIFQCLNGENSREIDKILLTASGGPFYGRSRRQLEEVGAEQALKHPNWNMGQKITTDSATLMNKGLELIEAVWLFGVTPEKVEVNVHRQSILHSAVEFEDGSVIGQMGVPDMRIPIQFALTYPERLPSPAKRLSLFDVGTMTFEKADEETFLCLKYAKKMIARGGTACTVLNSANEAAVGLFLEDKIPFYRIGEFVADACENVREHKEVTLGNILDSENTAREYVIAHA